jgi:endonuclease YncB( thermonuclease family)
MARQGRKSPRFGRARLRTVHRAVNLMRGAFFALGFFVTMAAPAFTDDLVGQASIVDGDTLEIHGARIRLWGIDAP